MTAIGATLRVAALLLVGLLFWIAVGLFVFVAVTEACEPIEVGPNTPTGIAGCERWGPGIASTYGPGGGAAMNFCTWTLRHTLGCGAVVVTAIDTGITLTVPVVDYCDCFTGTPDERIIDLQSGVVAALGLDPSRGLWSVRVHPAPHRAGVPEAPAPPPLVLPNTSMEAPND